MSMQVDIVSAEESIYSDLAEFVLARAAEGEVGILPRHVPMLAQLQPGEVKVRREGGEEELYYVSGGMIEVQPEAVTILADAAVRAKDLDEAKAVEAKRRAEEALKQRGAEMDYAHAQAELAEAVAQLRTIEKLRRTYGRSR